MPDWPKFHRDPLDGAVTVVNDDDDGQVVIDVRECESELTHRQALALVLPELELAVPGPHVI